MSETTASQDGAKLRIMVVDDHPIARQGLAALINDEPDWIVCCEATDATEALRLISQERPGLAIIDLSLESHDGIELIKQVKSLYPEVVMLVVSMHDEAIYAERAVRAGAMGYVMKAEAPEAIRAAIRTVLAGQIHVSPRLASHLLHRITGQPMHRSPLDALTDRELQIFQCIAQGMRMREIAEKLFVSVKTVEAHREHIKRKLNLSSSTELLRYAIQHGQEKTV